MSPEPVVLVHCNPSYEGGPRLALGKDLIRKITKKGVPRVVECLPSSTKEKKKKEKSHMSLINFKEEKRVGRNQSKGSLETLAENKSW
jgi:hypothetical protein